MRKVLIILTVLLLIAAITANTLAYESLTYLYGGTTSTYLTRMGKTGGNITVVAPDYFETNASGGVDYTKTPDPLLIASMHDRNVRVTPFLSNHWKRDQARAMLADRAAAAAYLASLVTQHGLDGLDIDIQNITEADRADFTDFIRLLKAAMPDGAELTVCVAANPYRTNVGWQGGYDYAALAEYCDHVFMMTYDESYEGSAPGPVSSMWFIEESIKYGLEHVPPEKLMMGIPFYGRYWSENGKKGYAWTIADIEYIISQTDAQVTYDETKQCAVAKFTIGEGVSVKTWGGSTVPADTYEVYYENERSYKAKLALVRKYGLRGAGSWALGQEPSYVWSNYSAWLKGYPFDDIENNWAQSYIIALTDEGLLNGRSEKLFVPDGTLTRAEAATLLCRIAGLNPVAEVAPFGDTANHWAVGYIAAAKNAELVNGISDTQFQPDRPVTREEFAVIAERYTNLTDTYNFTDAPFSDVSRETNPWSSDAIVKLSTAGVLNGYGDGTFRPHKTISRAEAAKTVVLLRELPTRFIGGEVIPTPENFMGPR